MNKCLVKADDFYATSSQQWRSFLRLCRDEKIPVTLGFIGKHIHQGRDPDSGLVRLAKNGRNEVWNHGLHHWRNEANGTAEFCGPAYEDQREAIGTCQTIAETVFGARPAMFGPPFNAYDTNTLKAVADYPEIELAYDFACHPTIPTIPKHYYVSCDVADSGRRFNPDRAREQSRPFMLRGSPFVIQIHPGNHWTEGCLDKFKTFTRFVRASGYRFVKPRGLLS